MMVALAVLPRAAYADCTNTDPNKPVCTCFEDLEPKLDAGDDYILSNISSFIQDVIVTATEDLFYAFTDSIAYQNALMAVATLMVIFYAIGFMIGVVQASFAEVLKRLILIGLVFTAISLTGFDFFSQYVVTFFNDGTDELIGGVMEISTGIPYTHGDSPFVAIDGIASYIISPDMIIAVLGAMMSGGPFSLGMGALLAIAVMAMLKLLIEALRIYAVSYILRALLLGVAPIFFAFLFFQKTKPLFMSWVSALVNLSLQPIIYFTFLAFFITLISSATRDMLGGQELCWVEYQNVSGTENKRAGWRFMTAGSSFPDVSEYDWQGAIACKLSDGGDCREFPFNIIDLLTFMLLVYVGSKFGAVTNDIAQDIANANISLGNEFQMPSFGGKGGGAPPPASGGRSVNTIAGGAVRK
jgi:hypothetical protein